MDNALCGGGDPMVGFTNNTVQISDSAVKMIKAAIFFGNLRAQYGLPYQVGSCRSGGVCLLSTSLSPGITSCR